MNLDQCSLVSIIVPVYRVEKYLRRCIDSIIAQTYKNIEIILVDDGSPDRCGAICDEYAKQDIRIQVIHTQNQGVSAARNTGLDNAHGEYISFVDSDDYVVDQYIDVMLNAIKQNNVDSVFCSYSEFNDSRKTNMEIIGNREDNFFGKVELLERLCYTKFSAYNCDFTSVWGKLYKKNIIQRTRFNTNMILGEDFLFNFDIFNGVTSVICIPEILYRYNIYDDSTMRSKKTKKVKETQREIEKIYKCYFCKINNEKIKKALIAKLVNMSITLYLLTDEALSNEKDRIEQFIITYRKEVLQNQQIKRKLRIALYCSYLGLKFTGNVYTFIINHTRG